MGISDLLWDIWGEMTCRGTAHMECLAQSTQQDTMRMPFEGPCARRGMGQVHLVHQKCLYLEPPYLVIE